MAKIESCYHSSAHYHLNQQRSKHSILFMPVFRFARDDLERGGGGGGQGRRGERASELRNRHDTATKIEQNNVLKSRNNLIDTVTSQSEKQLSSKVFHKIEKLDNTLIDHSRNTITYHNPICLSLQNFA